MRSRSWMPFVLSLALAGCGGAPGDADDSGVQADSVAMARAALTPATFDTISWKTPQEADDRGATVFAYSCRKCHGVGGRGDGGFVLRGDTLRPPSFLAPDWRFATDRQGLRAYIFAGNTKGMPHWGLVGLKPRDVDAVAAYIQDVLRQGS